MAYTFPGDPNATPVYTGIPISTAAQMQRSTGTVKPGTLVGFNPALVQGGIPFTADANPFFGG